VKYTLAHAFTPNTPNAKTLGAHQQEGGDHQSLSATGESLNFVTGLGVGKLPDEESKEQLRGQERKTGFGHRIGILLIDQVTVDRDVLRHGPHVHHDGNRRGNCDHYDGHREYLRHIPRLWPVESGLLSNRRRVNCGDSLIYTTRFLSFELRYPT